MNYPSCLMCHRKNDTSMLQRITLIQNKVASYDETTSRRTNLADAFAQCATVRCPYGLPCDKLHHITSETVTIARRMEPKLVTYIINADKHQLYELLQLTRGYFPTAYKAIERLWYTEHTK